MYASLLRSIWPDLQDNIKMLMLWMVADLISLSDINDFHLPALVKRMYQDPRYLSSISSRGAIDEEPRATVAMLAGDVGSKTRG
jgi:hypothetical protein